MKFTSTTSLVTILALNPAIQARPSKAISASRLAELERRHAEILGIQNGTHHDAAIEKPAVQVLIAGGYLIAAFAEGSISFGSLVNALRLGLNGQETPWNSGSNCLAKFQTHDGAECQITTYPAAKSGASKSELNDHIENWNVCPWVDFSQPPPVQYFDDPGIGAYSVQHTATNEVAWDGIEGTITCVAEGLCHPQLVFYRDTYSLVINTWQTQGDPTAGQYFGEFGGICGNGEVKNQFRDNGVVMGYDCAIPCITDTDLPDDTV